MPLVCEAPRRVVVTGGSGFIGSHLLRRLVSSSSTQEVVVLDRVPPRIESPKIRFVQVDIRQPLDHLVGSLRNFDACVHLAAVCKEPGYEWDEYFAANLTGTIHVLDLASHCNIPQFVFTSTMMVFRASDDVWSEASCPNPDTAYGISKAVAEVEVKSWARSMAGRRAAIVRPGVVFGYEERGNVSRMFRALRRGYFAYIGRPSTVKGCVYVKDLVGLIVDLLDEREPYTLLHAVYPDPLTVQDIVEGILSEFGWARLVPTVPYPLALSVGYIGEALAVVGVRTPLHHRRIQKLRFSTNLSAEPFRRRGYPRMTFPMALSDWRKDSGGMVLE